MAEYELYHYGVRGMKWGELTNSGRAKETDIVKRATADFEKKHEKEIKEYS